MFILCFMDYAKGDKPIEIFLQLTCFKVQLGTLLYVFWWDQDMSFWFLKDCTEKYVGIQKVSALLKNEMGMKKNR